MQDLEFWGGVECSVNRVGEVCQDQMEMSGHAHRIEDLQLIAGLGIRTLRYPVLWERVAPRSVDERDWAWSDERLQKLRCLAIDPIVGLLHHGSGPKYTNLLDHAFPEKFARFAGDVAQRYPWVTRYTPINEPLTTARFSALYGLWFPHRRDDRSFVRAFVNQCRATVLAMKAIRCVNPKAELVQTEDLGTTYGTSHMAYQREFDNERRWLTWDLLSARVGPDHPLRDYLERSGIACEELDWFIANPCSPQVIGINHYVTSDRFLDERTWLYPRHVHGGNGREAYADADAVRVIPGVYDGWRIIEAAAARYAKPVALTEVHIGCTREEQLRWFDGALEAVKVARRGGHDVRALTAWSLFGSYNWDKLLTRTDGTYESGAFDVRSPHPRATAVANLISQSTSLPGEGAASTVPLTSGGWWQRADKVLYGTLDRVRAHRPAPARSKPRKLIVCGANGMLGRMFVGECKKRNLACLAVTREQLDFGDAAAVHDALDRVRPWAIVNAAGYAQVDRAQHDVERCLRDNVRGPATLAQAANLLEIPFVTFSSDMVFDGERSVPYTESSTPSPLNVYGGSQLTAELDALVHANTLCVRTAACFGADDAADFLGLGLAALARGDRHTMIDDLTVSPTYLPDLATTTLDLAIDRCVGLVHLVNQGAATCADFLETVAIANGIDVTGLMRRSIADMDLAARRPLYSALASERVFMMPTLDDAIERYSSAHRDCQRHARSAARHG